MEEIINGVKCEYFMFAPKGENEFHLYRYVPHAGIKWNYHRFDLVVYEKLVNGKWIVCWGGKFARTQTAEVGGPVDVVVDEVEPVRYRWDGAQKELWV